VQQFLLEGEKREAPPASAQSSKRAKVSPVKATGKARASPRASNAGAGNTGNGIRPLDVGPAVIDVTGSPVSPVVDLSAFRRPTR
jgi:hypothetical protein